MTKRRGRGEGSIFERDDGQWCASVTVGYTETGKRRRRSVYGRTKAAVQEKLVRMQSASLDGMLGDTNRMTVGKYLEHWLETSAKTTVRPTTYRRYEGIVRMYVNPHLGGVRLSQLQPSQVQALYTRLEGDGATPRTRAITHAVLHTALKQAMKWNFVVRNVCDAVTKPRAVRKEMRVLNADEVAVLFEAARSDRLSALYVLAITTGLRLGELLGLQWPDVDMRGLTLAVRRTLVDMSTKRFVAEPKTSKGRRQVELPEMAITALRQHRERMLAEGITTEWVFSDTLGGSLRQTNVRRRSFEPLLARAKLPKIRFHDLRHTAATLLLQQGVHPKIVQERLGHSQIAMTLDTYSHVLPSMQRAAATKLDELFSAPSAEIGYKLATKSVEAKPVAVGEDAKVIDITSKRRHAQRDSNPRHSVPKTARVITMSRTYGARGRSVEGSARRVLELVKEGRPVPDALLAELAKSVLDRPAVMVAQRILAGGPGVISAGVELAGLLLQSDLSTERPRAAGDDTRISSRRPVWPRRRKTRGSG